MSAHPECRDHERCESCGERLCSKYGPEPAITCLVHVLCVDCEPHLPRCRDCLQAKRDAA